MATDLKRYVGTVAKLEHIPHLADHILEWDHLVTQRLHAMYLQPKNDKHLVTPHPTKTPTVFAVTHERWSEFLQYRSIIASTRTSDGTCRR